MSLKIYSALKMKEIPIYIYIEFSITYMHEKKKRFKVERI